MIQELIALLLPNLQLVLFGVVILGFTVAAKIISGTLKNIFTFKYAFDWKWLLEGIVKGISFTIAILFIAAVAAVFPKFLEMAGIFSESITKAVSVLAITVIIAAAIAKYFVETTKNLMIYLDITQADIDMYELTPAGAPEMDPADEVVPEVAEKTEILG